MWPKIHKQDKINPDAEAQEINILYMFSVFMRVLTEMQTAWVGNVEYIYTIIYININNVSLEANR